MFHHWSLWNIIGHRTRVHFGSNLSTLCGSHVLNVLLKSISTKPTALYSSVTFVTSSKTQSHFWDKTPLIHDLLLCECWCKILMRYFTSFLWLLSYIPSFFLELNNPNPGHPLQVQNIYSQNSLRFSSIQLAKGISWILFSSPNFLLKFFLLPFHSSMALSDFSFWKVTYASFSFWLRLRYLLSFKFPEPCHPYLSSTHGHASWNMNELAVKILYHVRCNIHACG